MDEDLDRCSRWTRNGQENIDSGFQGTRATTSWIVGSLTSQPLKPWKCPVYKALVTANEVEAPRWPIGNVITLPFIVRDQGQETPRPLRIARLVVAARMFQLPQRPTSTSPWILRHRSQNPQIAEIRILVDGGVAQRMPTEHALPCNLTRLSSRVFLSARTQLRCPSHPIPPF